MDATEIAGFESELVGFLCEFDDCFGRSEPREHLRTYVSGQLSALQRKSVEPIALAADVPPRTLQRFLESIEWDEERLRDKSQQIVARDHADPDAIGVVEETGHPKKGIHTAGVKRQWCGNTGKVDNCVVSVHTGYVVGDFQCLLDSDVYLPEDWANDVPRRRAAYIPDDVTFRTKPEIALDQIRRCLDNGIRMAAWTFDELCCVARRPGSCNNPENAGFSRVWRSRQPRRAKCVTWPPSRVYFAARRGSRFTSRTLRRGRSSGKSSMPTSIASTPMVCPAPRTP